MYEYDPTEPSLGQAFANMLRGFQNPQQWQETGQGIVNTAKAIPSVVESLGRGGVAQAVGTMGDLRDLRNTVQSYLPQSVQNFSNAAEFLTNPYAKALIQTAPTTEQTLEAVPRITPTYEGAGQHEVLGEFIAPSLGYFGGKALKAGKGLPVGLSIEDVTPPPAKVAEALRQPEKNALGFYSPLEEAVLGLKNEKGTGQQYLAQLLKTQGVKQEEVATRGLDTFLNENPKVSKEQLINYLRENPVELKETILSADSPRSSDSMSYEDYRLNEGQPIDDPEYIRSRADDIAYDYEANNPDIVQLMRENSMEELGFTPKDLENPYNQAKFEEYVNGRIYDDAYEQAKSEYWDNPYNEYTDEFGYKVVGNDDVGYHVTDPNGRTLRASNNGIYDIDEVEQAIRDDAVEQGLLHYADDEYGTKYYDYTLPNGENYKEVLIQYEPKRSPPNYEIRELPESMKEAGKNFGVYEGDRLINKWHGQGNAEDWVKGQKANYKDYGNYESGHFDEPNILTHLRTTDRTIDGKKTLFVEEIQSDWHQQGRKKGYKSGQNVEKQYENLMLDMKKDVSDKMYQVFKESYEDAPKLREKSGNKSVDELAKEATETYIGRLSFEDLAKEAGKFDEWNRLKDELAVERHGVPNAPFKKNWQELAMKRAMQMAAEGGYDRVAFTTGKQQAERYSLSKQVNDITAEKILSGPRQGEYNITATDKNGRMAINEVMPENKLEDLVGKELAKKIVEDAPDWPDGKKYSGLDLDVGGEGMKGFYDKILPDFINKYGKKHGLKTGKTKMRTSTDKQAAEDAYLLSELGHPDIKPTGFETVHYFDLTPEAKESFLKKGQPMFAVAPALAITDEDSRREVLEKLFNSKK